MKLVRYRHDSAVRLGVLDPEAGLVQPLADDVAGAASGDLRTHVEASPTADPDVRTSGAPVALADVRLLAPLHRPARNIFCVGKNYHEHAAEFARSGYDATGGGDATPQRPIVFTKPESTIVGPGDLIDPHPDVTDAVDYEAEIAVIVGRGGRNIAPGDVADHVWGYTLVNDVTARDLQQAHKQWFIGKALDTFCPMGPWAVTRDELDGVDVELTCHVNGELRQRASVRDLVFDVPTLVSTLSAGITLRPGDLIATGTPAGVGIGFDPPRFLAPGDEVRVSATGLGSLLNTVGGAR